MHSLPPRTDSERTRKSWPSEILTTSAALGSSAMAMVMSALLPGAHASGGGVAHARQTLPRTAAQVVGQHTSTL